MKEEHLNTIINIEMFHVWCNAMLLKKTPEACVLPN